MAEAKAQKIGDLLTKIEQALDQIEAKLGGAGAGSSTGGGGGSSSVAVGAFEALVADHLANFVDLAKKIAPEVEAQSQAFVAAVGELKNLIAHAAGTKKPAQADFVKALAPLSTAIGKIGEVRDKHRTSKFGNNLSALADGVPALGWVMAEKNPGPFCKEQGEPAIFYTNKILKDFKDKDETQVAWVKAFTGFLNNLPNYIKQHHTTGLVWAK